MLAELSLDRATETYPDRDQNIIIPPGAGSLVEFTEDAHEQDCTGKNIQLKSDGVKLGSEVDIWQTSQAGNGFSSPTTSFSLKSRRDMLTCNTLS